ncbi:MAG: peptidyl-prolyl cis-trans isomerase [Fibrobacter sp.]|jgi:hypothetical protein|nr:peptidyl-prolyl cis-trans isomerase [Fibrobacter sp.]
MPNKSILFPALFVAAFLYSCSSGRDEAVVSVAGQKINRSDINLILMFDAGFKALDSSAVLGNLIEETRIAAYAKAKYGDPNGRFAELLASQRERMLAQFYQRYYQEDNYGYSEDILIRYFEANPDSFKPSYYTARAQVAKSLYLKEHQDSLAAFSVEYQKNFSGAAIAEESVREAFLGNVQTERTKRLMDSLRTAYGIQNEKIVPPGVREYYDAHLNEFMTEPGYIVYHIEFKDSAALAGKMSAVKSLEQFKTLAQSESENTWTKPKSGFVGEIREEHALPYGIGLLPPVFEWLRAQDSGTVSPVFKSAAGTFQVFYLESKVAPKQKPFERVQKTLEERLAADALLDSSFVLVTSQGKPFLTEGDILKVKAEIPERERMRYPRARLRQMLTEWKMLARAARESGYEKNPMTVSFFKLSENSLYQTLFQDSLFAGVYSEEALEGSYRLNGERLFPGGTFGQVKNILARWMATPPLIMRHEYFYNLEMYASFPDFIKAEPRVFAAVRGKDSKNAYLRKYLTFKDQYPVTVLNKSWLPLSGDYSKEALISEAETAYEARNLDKAISKWQTLRGLYPDDETLFARSVLEVAKLESEKENFLNAEKEYRAFYSLFPQNENAEKALFSRAFTLRDGLKNDSAALVLFKEFKEKYPSSELSESADWMIQDIESGGKLSDELMKIIEKSEPGEP